MNIDGKNKGDFQKMDGNCEENQREMMENQIRKIKRKWDDN